MSETDDPSPQTRADQILEAFERFHLANPRIWVLFQQFTLRLSNAGHTTYSAKAVFEVIRWHIDTDTSRPDGQEAVRLNNNYTAYYARMFHLRWPNLGNFFKVRKLISEDKLASDEDRQVFIREQEAAEQAITDRLRRILD